MNDKSRYEFFKSNFGEFFCVDNLRKIYDDDTYDFRVSFLDFILCIEDFYTFVYSPKLSKNAWMLFTWLRTLVRYDGYVELSYKDVSSKFNDGKSVMMSKPTFFKCISELESYDLVKRFSNKKLFDSKIQNDVNTYIVISKLDAIIPLLDGMKTQNDFYGILRKEFFSESKTKKDIKPIVKPDSHDNKVDANEIMTAYSNVSQELNDLFAYLGSSNKSGNIAKTRKTNILNRIYEIDPYDDYLTHAISQTIAKGIKSEKYLYAILNNLMNNNKPDNKQQTASESKIRERYKTNVTANNKQHAGISHEQYIQFRTLILTRRTGYKTVLQKMHELGIINKRPIANDYEQRLYSVCQKLIRKDEILKEASYIRGNRMQVLKKQGIYELIRYDNTLTEYISWAYEKDDSKVSINVIKELSKKYPDEFRFFKIQILE